ncbi:hypothetical protein [Paenibacillus herberti]|uniref:Uncharacterized protein n=1 Tax=Paenibacillus herberti TaxID=1619309 RepID=A0A229P5I5_9BACL|nr:hypothetical protein [Paenibacillus herberti]OXM17360.1 hypothetical protein CGZ75_12370 [Paenibacillus herberti]
MGLGVLLADLLLELTNTDGIEKHYLRIRAAQGIRHLSRSSSDMQQLFRRPGIRTIAFAQPGLTELLADRSYRKELLNSLEKRRQLRNRLETAAAAKFDN